MSQKIDIRPLSLFAEVADVLVNPIIKLVTGAPQQTHCWNNHHIPCDKMQHLDRRKMVYVPGDKDAVPRSRLFDVRFHIPRVGGWKRYVVLEPRDDMETWHVGWVTDRCGVSRIPLHGRVRMLVGHEDCYFVGFDADGKQIAIRKMAEGVLGETHAHDDIPLL